MSFFVKFSDFYLTYSETRAKKGWFRPSNVRKKFEVKRNIMKSSYYIDVINELNSSVNFEVFFFISKVCVFKVSFRQGLPSKPSVPFFLSLWYQNTYSTFYYKGRSLIGNHFYPQLPYFSLNRALILQAFGRILYTSLDRS